MEVNINVDFYNDEERELIKKNYPEEYDKFEKIVEPRFVRVSFADFKVYSQMHHRNNRIEKLKSFTAILSQIGDLYGNVNVYTNFDPETGRFTAENTTNNEQNHVSESIGCGGVLSVLGIAYDLTQADWQRIDIQDHKDFDFDSAVIENFNKMIVVETKGSIVEDNTSLEKASKHKAKIKGKKNDLEFLEKYAKKADLLLGGITLIDDVNHMKVLLVDPPVNSDLTEEFRFKIKIIKRITYYNDWIALISTRSYLSITLNNRLNALKIIDDIRPFDFVTLTNSNEEVLKLQEGFIKSRSHIDQKIVGKLYVFNKNKAVFIGLPVEIYNLLAIQDFSAIAKFRIKASITKKKIELKLSRSSAQYSEFIQNINIHSEINSSKLFQFSVTDADVFQNSAGLVYSILTNNNNYNFSYE
ncbi:hypothetical protein [Leeuwenhoekiella sp. LLG6367-2.1]|uniref:hypothetical protein n=1 Tax=Leeuwenhoekiella sp. LLG6367-2.1 TaxID=3160833 RepID=UPI0038682C87